MPEVRASFVQVAEFDVVRRLRKDPQPNAIRPYHGSTPSKMAFREEGLTILCGHLLFHSSERLQSENHAGRGYVTLAMAVTFVRLPKKNLSEDTRSSKGDLSTVTVSP
jgi:hypothetical protein